MVNFDDLGTLGAVEPAPRPNDETFADATHSRWRERRLRKTEDPAYLDEWYAQQCGGCRFWMPLTGILGSDYGGCTNPVSVRDGVVQFEHDGCDAFAPAPDDEWGSAPR